MSYIQGFFSTAQLDSFIEKKKAEEGNGREKKMFALLKKLYYSRETTTIRLETTY